LRLPWGSLFGMLENIDMPQVSMLALEPDARQRKLRVTAESDDIESMLAYVHMLSRQPILEDVMLLTHEQHNDGRSKPVSFVIEAAWLI
jgi:Tfp pilus assembly protein PilN